MQVQDELKRGDLDAALAAAKNDVRDNPSSAQARTVLFQLFAIVGDWERALTQLNLAGDMDPSALPMVQTYQEALACEALREQVFAGERSPLVFGDPEQWIALALEAQKLVAAGKYAEAAKLREQAYDDVETVAGSVNGEDFEWIADADTRIGPFFEAIISGKYYWIPLHRIASVVIEPPEDLRDLVWIPGHFSWANGGQTIGLIPVRYPDTHQCDKSALRLARLTEWSENPEETYCGVGQRMLVTDTADYPILEIREIKFDVEPAPESTD